MRQRIENKVLLVCHDVDLTTVSDLEVYVKQDYKFFQYTPDVTSASEMLVTIPYEDAMKLKSSPVNIQFAFTDANGNPDASGVVEIPVEVLLKEAGYDPV